MLTREWNHSRRSLWGFAGGNIVAGRRRRLGLGHTHSAALLDNTVVLAFKLLRVQGGQLAAIMRYSTRRKSAQVSHGRSDALVGDS